MPKKYKHEPIVFIDGVDWQHELGAALGGNRVYPDLEDALEHNPCAQACGVVKCKVVLIDWALTQDLNKGKYVTCSAEELKKDPDLQRLESHNGRLEWLNKEVESQKAKIEKLKQKIQEKNNAPQ